MSLELQFVAVSTVFVQRYLGTATVSEGHGFSQYRCWMRLCSRPDY